MRPWWQRQRPSAAMQALVKQSQIGDEYPGKAAVAAGASKPNYSCGPESSDAKQLTNHIRYLGYMASPTATHRGNQIGDE